MTVRSFAIAAITIVSCGPAVAQAAPTEAIASFRPQPNAVSAAPVAAYRTYAKRQADTLVAMTRALARAIEHGDLATAQVTYAPAHRYLALIAPIARALPALDKSMDARAEAFAAREADPAFSGFHRIENGLFTNRSTAGLSAVADRLADDARTLRDRIAVIDVTPAALLDGTIRNLEQMAQDSLTGGAERYSRTDLWDVEAGIEGTRQVVALTQPQDASTPVAATIAFARIDALLDTHKDGCGFKSYDQLALDDRQALAAPIAALAKTLDKTLTKTLAARRGTMAMD